MAIHIEYQEHYEFINFFWMWNFEHHIMLATQNCCYARKKCLLLLLRTRLYIYGWQYVYFFGIIAVKYPARHGDVTHDVYMPCCAMHKHCTNIVVNKYWSIKSFKLCPNMFIVSEQSRQAVASLSFAGLSMDCCCIFMVLLGDKKLFGHVLNNLGSFTISYYNFFSICSRWFHTQHLSVCWIYSSLKIKKNVMPIQWTVTKYLLYSNVLHLVRRHQMLVYRCRRVWT